MSTLPQDTPSAMGTDSGLEPPDRERHAWIARHVPSGSVLLCTPDSIELALLLAERGRQVQLEGLSAGTAPALAERLGALPAAVRERVRLASGGQTAAPPPAAGFDALVLDGPLQNDASAETALDQALGRVAPDGSVIVSAPLGVYGEQPPARLFTPGELLRLLQGRFAPQSVEAVGGWLTVAGRLGGDSVAGWAPLLELDRLERLAEAALQSAQTRLHAERDRLRAERDALWARLEGLERSASLRVGRAVVDALKRPVRGGLRLPLRLGGLALCRMRRRHSNAIPPAAETLDWLESLGQRLSWDPVAANLRIAGLERRLADREAVARKTETRLRAECRYQEFRYDLERFAVRVRRTAPSHLLMFVTGSGELHERNVYRPVQLAFAALRTGSAVIYGYHRWDVATDVPLYDGGACLQSPLDFTTRVLPALDDLDFGAARPVLFVSYPHPEIAGWVEAFADAGWTTVYDCQDDWAAFAEVGMARWYDAVAETHLARRCHVVTAVAGPLRDKLRSLTGRADLHLVPNGYDPAFRPADYRRAPASPAKVGYFGQLRDAWFDWPSLTAVAEARPELRFELIGPHAPAGLSLPPNVSLLGPRPAEALPGLAAEWSTAMICFRMGALADGVDPIKVYEYLALGHPVVSFRMPQIDHYPYTTTVETVPDFAAALDRAIATPPDPAKIAAWLEPRTWSRRADMLLALIDAVGTAQRGRARAQR